MPNKRGVKINSGLEIFVKYNKRGGQNKRGRVRISKKLLISVMNEKKRHKCLMLINET